MKKIILEEELELSKEKIKNNLVENEAIAIDFDKTKIVKENLLKENINTSHIGRFWLGTCA